MLQAGFVMPLFLPKHPGGCRLERGRAGCAPLFPLIFQLALLLAVFQVFRVEQFRPSRDSGFFLLTC